MKSEQPVETKTINEIAAENLKKTKEIKMRNYFLTLPLLFLMLNSYADIDNTRIASTEEQNTTINSTTAGNPQDWGLTTDEWTRYQQLMQGPNGHWYPNLTPPAVLGLNAQTNQDQQHFADIVAREEHDKLARELAFDNAVHQAVLRLYSNEPVIRSFNLSPFNPIKTSNSQNTVALQAGDHLTLFVDPIKGLDFMALPKLLTDVKSNAGVILDIFCVGNVDDSTIRRWAKLNNIPMELVSQGRITLNQDNGRLKKTVGIAMLPYAVLVRNGVSKPVSLWSLS